MKEFLMSEAFGYIVLGVAAYIVQWGWQRGVAKANEGDDPWEKRVSYMEAIKPYLVDAVKLAEKTIPDDTNNKALAKFDFALRQIVDMMKTKGEVTHLELIKRGITETADTMFGKKTDEEAPELS